MAAPTPALPAIAMMTVALTRVRSPIPVESSVADARGPAASPRVRLMLARRRYQVNHTIQSSSDASRASDCQTGRNAALAPKTMPEMNSTTGPRVASSRRRDRSATERAAVTLTSVRRNAGTRSAW